MRAVILTCLILSVLFALIAAEEKCKTGEKKNIECNSCNCVNEKWACTKKRCIQPRNKRETCTPGTTYKKDCNTCVCNADGVAACTLKLCIKKN